MPEAASLNMAGSVTLAPVTDAIISLSNSESTQLERTVAYSIYTALRCKELPRHPAVIETVR